MGEVDRYSEYQKSKKKRFTLGSDGNALVGLITIILFFFVLLLTIQVCYNFFQQPATNYKGQIIEWFGIPNSFTLLSERPWTIFTYMFSETGNMLFRLLGNLLWLWAFGAILQSMAGNDKLIPVFIYSGLIGGLVFVASSQIFPSTATLSTPYMIGSNPGVMGVAMATMALSPNFRVLTHIRNGFPVWILMAIYLIIDLAGFSSAPAAYSLSHVAGAATGAGFVFLMRRGYDLSLWMNRFYFWLLNLFNPNKTKSAQQKIKERVFYNTGSREPYRKTAIITQDRVDEILDKINQKGYQFLTEEEKQILRKAGENL